MPGVRRWGALALAMAAVFAVAQAGFAEPLWLQSEAQLSEPELAITKFAGLFVRDLIVEEEPLLVIRVHNPHAQSTTGTFRLTLSHSGENPGGQIGFIETHPVLIPPGETAWTLYTGGFGSELIVDLLESIGERTLEEVGTEIKDAFDWGTITEWKLKSWGGNETWARQNIFDWEAYSDLDAQGAAQLWDELRGLKLPAGTYTFTVQLTYNDPDTAQTLTETASTSWTITNPDPVRLVSPRADAAGFDGADPAGFNFVIELPVLPADYETVATIRLYDTVTRRWSSYSVDFVGGGREESIDGFEAFPDLVTGRRYEWTVSLVGLLSGRVVGGAAETVEFWLTNEPPVIEELEAVPDELIEGDRATFRAVYSDDGDPTSSLEVEWYIDGELVGTGPLLRYTFAEDIEEDQIVSVRLDVTDSFGATTSEFIDVTVRANQPPEAEILSPSAGDEFEQGARIVLEADVSDPEGEGVRRIEWYMAEAGAPGDGVRIGTGPRASLVLREAGERRITLSAEDMRGAVSRTSVTIVVNPAPVPGVPGLPAPGDDEGEAPEEGAPEIVQPVDQEVVIAGANVLLQAANVPESAAVAWWSSLSGLLVGSTERDGTTVSTEVVLEAGEQVIALVVEGIQRAQVTVIVLEGEVAGEAPVEIGTVISASSGTFIVDSVNDTRRPALPGTRFTNADVFELGGNSLLVLLDTGETAQYTKAAGTPAATIPARDIVPGVHTIQ